MADNMSSEQRSFTMSRIRSQGNKTTEKKLQAVLRSCGIDGWESQPDLPGKPDLVFREQRLVVFVDGCFWHGCPKCKLRPKTNEHYWKAKMTNNRKRDRKISQELRGAGWSVWRIWEHSLKNPGRIAAAVRRRLVCDHETLSDISAVSSGRPSLAE